MKTVLVYDTETTGLPNWKVPSDDPSQPHLVEIAAFLANAETGKVIERMRVIVKPDGWEIPQVTIDIHGITNEHALEHGIPEIEAIGMLLCMAGMYADTMRVAHNRTFDQRMIRIGLKRYGTAETMDEWARKDNHYCTCIESRKIMGGRNPKLSAALKHFTGEDLKNAHSAEADAEACMKVYFAMNPPLPVVKPLGELDDCPDNDCNGVMRFDDKDNCSCHIDPPPCNACVTPVLICDGCNLTNGDL